MLMEMVLQQQNYIQLRLTGLLAVRTMEIAAQCRITQIILGIWWSISRGKVVMVLVGHYAGQMTTGCSVVVPGG